MNRVVKYCYDNAEKPIYEQIADIMRKDIENGRIPPGKQLLPELKLAEGFNVSLVTMQRALKLLDNERLLVRSPKRGTFISDNAARFLSFKTIGLIMPALGAELTLAQSPVNYQIFDGIQKYCLENFWDIQIMQRKCESVSLERLSQSNISGLIIVMPNSSTYELISDLKKHQIPFLCVNLHSEEINKDINFINLDFYNTAIDAVKYLYEKGKRNIGIVSTYEISGDDKHHFHIIKGYEYAINLLGLNKNIIVPDANKELSKEHISDFIRNNLRNVKKCDAIITANSAGAFSLLNILKEEKIKIPEKISLISFFKNEKSIKAGIISYIFNLQELGYKSASLFSEILNDENKNIKQLKFKLDLFHCLSPRKK